MTVSTTTTSRKKKKFSAFHGKPAVKSKFLARIRKHRKMDSLIKGTGWENGKGCAVGCTLEKYDHMAYEKELGIPNQLAQIEDAIFEGLPNELAMQWPSKFLRAIKPGVDLSSTFHKFMVWMILDPVDGIIKFNNHEAVRKVAELHALAASGKMPDKESWSAARSAAESAAWSAAESAARSAARSAAESAAGSAAGFAAWSAAEPAARSAARSAAWSAAWSAAYIRQSEKLLELLRSTK